MSCSDLVSFNSNPPDSNWLLKQQQTTEDSKCQNCSGIHHHHNSPHVSATTSSNTAANTFVPTPQSQTPAQQHHQHSQNNKNAKHPFMCCWVKASMLLVEGKQQYYWLGLQCNACMQSTKKILKCGRVISILIKRNDPKLSESEENKIKKIR